MSYLITKALHIIFVVTWFAGLFYIVRLFIYATEAYHLKDKQKSLVLLEQFEIMKRRLWLGITWPSAIITFCLGTILVYLYGSIPSWLIIKFGFLFLLYLYHFSCHFIFLQQQRGEYRYSSFQLRLWNELATLFLFGIVFVVILKDQTQLISLAYGAVFLAILFWLSIKIYAKRSGR